MYAETVCSMGFERAVVYSSSDGMDEVSPYAKTEVYEIDNGSIKHFEIDPSVYISREEALTIPSGMTPEENAGMFIDIISSGTESPVAKLLAMNAALAIYAHNSDRSMTEGFRDALASITDGTVLKKTLSLRNEQ
jgi:anthranilate phosphoribosyltransferase